MAADSPTFRVLPPRAVDFQPIDQHAVQYYETDDFLLEAVTRFLANGISEGGCSIAIATKVHRTDLEARLVRRGLDLSAARRRGAYVALDAADTLGRLMVGDRPDAEKFESVVGTLIDRSIGGPPLRRVRVFGEMVALLSGEGHCEAAVEIERLWNDLALRRPFSVLHGYPLRAFAGTAYAEGFAKVTAAHAHVAPTESYLELDPDERLRAVAELQQRVAALEAELAARG